MSSGPEIGISNGTIGSQGSLEQMKASFVAISNEQKLSSNGFIYNKFNDIQHGKEYNYIFNGNRVKTENGIKTANFVIDSNGKLHIGNGHSYMSGGQPVQAAGTIKINSQGMIRRVTNLSGHYQPNVNETIRYLNQMHKSGYISNTTWVDIYNFNKAKSGYVSKVTSVYSGPFQYMNRRFSKWEKNTM